ncbi:carbohydrate sulfotransferase 5 isoform X3 [Cephus cinctus]|uniref:Carbohydrate sulfotransferase 5 isoform X3 n=1 Tax=Cephus cinctus TaxID=211228 RepID=A0AAJ7RLQ9_CEPCN|nr:carbohydrate sulfotransferase 5 isoform X3 [Cephus cinctus]
MEQRRLCVNIYVNWKHPETFSHYKEFVLQNEGTKMSKKLSFYGLVALASLCLFFLLFNQRYSGYLEQKLQPVYTVSRKFESYVRGITTNNNNSTIMEIHRVIDQQRKAIEREMVDYNYPNGLYGINARCEQWDGFCSKLEDFVMEKGGRPMRSVILTTWRSGSTFFGDVLNAHPANFYHYEPLLDFGIVQVRNKPLAEYALRNIKAMFHCDFSDMDHYLDYGKTHSWLFNHNTHLWRQCQLHKKICWDPRFASGMCRLFPFQSMKLVRLRLQVAEELLADESLGVRMVFLIRDPRGTLQSRKHRDWCPDNPDCADPALVCSDMVSDYNMAVKLFKKYPTRFIVVRYEDLSVDPYRYVQDLFTFYGLDFHSNVKLFLDTHTKNDVGGVSSTYRNSKAAPFHWRTDFDFETVEKIQRVCADAMALWGYVMAVNATHQKDFNPITSYRLK